VRVGIHLGDIVEEADGDLMGDGVNIAARLQAGFQRYAARRRELIAAQYDALLAEAGITPEMIAADKAARAERNYGGRRPGAGWKPGLHRPRGARLWEAYLRAIAQAEGR
jgi:hypothetical protein